MGIFSRHVQNSANACVLKVDAGLGSVVKFVSTEGGSVNKETLTKRFPFLL